MLHTSASRPATATAARCRRSRICRAAPADTPSPPSQDGGPQVVLFSVPGCHLCDALAEKVGEAIASSYGPLAAASLLVVDVSAPGGDAWGVRGVDTPTLKLRLGRVCGAGGVPGAAPQPLLAFTRPSPRASVARLGAALDAALREAEASREAGDGAAYATVPWVPIVGQPWTG